MARLGRLPRQSVKVLLVERFYPRPGRLRGHARPSKNNEETTSGWRESAFKVFEGGATALGSILVLGSAGYGYHMYYKSLVLSKMENAFAAGYSSLELAALQRHTSRQDDLGDSSAGSISLDFDNEDWVPRDEQIIIDRIVNGTIQGQYHLLTGEKGTGKTSMLLKAMGKIDGEGVAMLEAHGDLEIFRVRLGKALDYEFHEDYIGSFFSVKGPRDTTALLDIERAFNKMEKIALKRKEAVGKPLVLIINGIHLLRDNEDGGNLLELIQQRAELWAASNLVTIVLNSDDYWITERLMWQATRLRIIPVHDIQKNIVLEALKSYRARNFHESVSLGDLEQVYNQVGGRLRFISQVAKSKDMLRTCNAICQKEKRWLLNQCWVLGRDIDDHSEDQQDFSAAAMILAKALVEKERQMKRNGIDDGRLPQMPLHEARQLMTRHDFMQKLDHISIVTIDSNSMVQADSVPMQNAFRDICLQDGFEDHLAKTLERLDELESLGRTREVVLKDLKDLKDIGEVQAVLQDGDKGVGHFVVSIRAKPSLEGPQ